MDEEAGRRERTGGGDAMVRDPRARNLVLASCALGAFASTVMGTSVNVALPSLVEALDRPFPVVQWVVLAYLLSMAALLPVLGRLADLVGKKRILLGGFAAFALGSLASGLAPGVASLIAARTVQGVGAAVLAAVGLAIVTDAFPAAQRGRAIGINGSVLSTGIVIGPTLGGLLVDGMSWRWVFLIGVPLGVVGFLLAARFVPAYPRGARVRFDLPGALALGGALASLSLALTLGQGLGFASAPVLGLAALAVALGAAFVAIERRARAPVLDLALFREPELVVGLLSGLAAFVSIAGVIFLMPFYLEEVRGFAPREVGLLMSVVPILLVVVAPVAGALADRRGERLVAVVGLASALVGFAAVSTLDETTTAAGYLLRFVPVAIGMATFQSSNNSAIMGAVPRAMSGTAGGLLALTRALGQTMGIAVLGSLWAARTLARGAPAGGDATAASPAAQVAGLQETMLVVLALVGAALALGLADLRRSRRAAAAPGAGAPEAGASDPDAPG